MSKRIAFGLVAVLLTVSAGAWRPLTSTSTHASGIEIVGRAIGSAPWSDSLKRAFTDVLRLAETNDGFGYPWADGATGNLVVRTTTPSGNQLAQQWLTKGVVDSNPKAGALQRPGVPVRFEAVALSYRELESIKDDATRLVLAGVPDADAIYETEPDWEHNRVIITTSRKSDGLLNALAARYGTSAIAVRVEARPVTLPQTRTHDYNPFYGGAIIWTGYDGCSSGFSWTDGVGTQYMMTAGHCAPNGATSVTTTDANFNYVDTMATSNAITSGSRENWTTGPGNGTTMFPSDSTYRGDVALITLNGGKSVAAFIYSGAKPDETSASTVHNMWTTVPAYGEEYCVGGSNQYALCGWNVQSVRINWQYMNGEWIRNATKGLKASGTSANFGDSGGPVYTVNGTGTIAAKGIHSGGTYGPASCSVISTCFELFTDILLPYYYFPGWLKTL